MDKLLKGLLTKVVVDKIGKEIGENSTKTKSAMEGLLPAILGGLAQNSAKKDGAQKLEKALEKHDGSVLDNLDGLLGNIAGGKGDKILKHVLGGKTSEVEEAVSEESGMKKEKTSKLMEILAPMVMGSLGKEVKNKGLSSDMLSGLLKGSMKGVLKDGKLDYTKIAMMFLDKDGDGDFKDDLLDMGKKYLKKFMS